jgi:hypothetical protein
MAQTNADAEDVGMVNDGQWYTADCSPAALGLALSWTFVRILGQMVKTLIDRLILVW